MKDPTLARLLLLCAIISSSFLPAPLAGVRSAEAAPSGPTLRAIRFNGVDSFLRVLDHPALTPADSRLTLTAWVNTEVTSGCQTILGKDYRTSYWLGLCNGRLRFYTRGSGTSVTGSTVVPAAWTHIAVTYDGTTRRYYINGELELESTAGNGPLVSNGAPLGIGFDPGSAGTFTPNYFKGLIDDVSIVNGVRSQEEVRRSIRGEITTFPSYAWRFDGSPFSSTAASNTEPVGGYAFDTDGARPHDMTVYARVVAPTIDGACTGAEYGPAQRFGLKRTPLGSAFIQYDSGNLYLCVEQMELGAGTSVAVALDANGSLDEYAGPGDLRFRVTAGGALSVEQGNGAGGFEPASAPADSWAAASVVTADTVWSAEFRIRPVAVGLTSWPRNNVLLNVVQLGLSSGPNPWPVWAGAAQPRTWSKLAFGGPATTAVHKLTGRVTDASGAPLAGVRLRVSSVIPSGPVGTVTTNASGEYDFRLTSHAPAGFTVEEVDPAGAYSISAAGTDTDALTNDATGGASVLYYPGSATGSYAPGLFVDAFGVAAAPALDRHYLIVFGSPVTTADLAQLVDAKRRQGFQVETASTDVIRTTVAGRELSDKIRNWLRARWQAIRPAPVYALLVGNGEVIPVRDVGTEYDIPINAENPLYTFPAPASDWFYADLDSEWNADGDNAYGEFLWCAPGTARAAVPGIHGEITCPTADSPLRDGPFGTLSGTTDDWLAEIAVGRIAESSRAGVRAAIAAAVAAHESAAAEKANSLLAGSLWQWEDQIWDPDAEAYVSREWDGARPFGFDSAQFLAGTLGPALVAGGIENLTTLYTTASPGSDPALRPSLQTADYPLTQDTFAQLWAGTHPTTTLKFGLVNVSGHGSPGGTAAEQWTNDWNADGIVTYRLPRADATVPCPEGDEYCYELAEDMPVNLSLPAPGGVPPVMYANACSTGALGKRCAPDDADTNPYGDKVCTVGNVTVPGTLQREGKVAAWIGALDPIITGGMDDHHAAFTGDMLAGAPLGDALWKRMGLKLRGQLWADWRDATMTLFGDPAATYWGNSLETRAFWPQSGRDWLAASAAPVSGPRSGVVLWTSAPGVALASPVVDARGNALVSSAGQIGRFAQDGTGTAVAPIAGGATRPLALTTGGLYAVSASTVRFYRSDFSPAAEVALPGGATVTGDPLVTPEGILYIPTSGGLFEVTRGGQRMLGTGSVAGAALTRSGAVVWTTAAGLWLHRPARFGDESTRQFAPLFAPTAPVVAPDGRIVLAQGSVVSVFAEAGVQQWSTSAGQPVVGRPAVGPDGAIYVAGASGVLTALERDGAVRWRAYAGESVPAALSTDGAQVFALAGTRVIAVDATGGEVRWSVDVGGPGDARSQPVIGANRTLYVSLASGRLVAVGEGVLRIPGDVVARAETGALAVEWRDTNIAESGYLVEACPGSPACAPGTAVSATLPPNSGKVTLGQLPPGQPLHVRVRALAANPELASDFVYAPPVAPLPPAPPSPQSVKGGPAGPGEVEVEWAFAGAADTVLSFDIQRGRSSGGPFETISVTGAADRRFRDAGALPGASLFYRLRARGAGGASAWSAPFEVRTSPATLPAPARFAARAERGSVRLMWSPPASAVDGYLLERMLPGSAAFEPLARIPGGKQSYDDLNVGLSGVLEYRIRSFAGNVQSPARSTRAELGKFRTLLPLISR